MPFSIGSTLRQGAKILGQGQNYVQKVIGAGVSIVKKLNEIIPDLNKFVGETKALIERVGNETIKSITSCRIPLSGALSGIVNALHKGPIPIDKFFHLFLRLGLGNGQHVIFEKNERPMMSLAGADRRAEEQDRSISVSPGLTVNKMIENGIEKVGATNYFNYDPFYKNCQQFQIANLSASPQIHMSQSDKEWIDQNAQEIARGIPSWAKSASSQVIQLFNKISGRIV